jgi:MFS family permease
MNAPASVVFPTHTTFEWSLAVSAFAIGGPGGAVLGGYLANKKGRKGTYTTALCSYTFLDIPYKFFHF